MAPTSKRIAEDISTSPPVLEKAIEAKGTALQDNVVRHGRRLERHEPVYKNARPLKHKPRAHQRKGTPKSKTPSHPHADGARKIIQGAASGQR